MYIFKCYTVESREANRPEEINMAVLSRGLTSAVTDPASLGSSIESHITGTTSITSTYNTPKPFYINQHMVKPVYTYLCSQLDDEHRRTPMVRLL